MSTEIDARPLGTIAKLAAVAALALFLMPRTVAEAQIYPGWDFGNGFGIGIGVPPSAYNPCPTYGWPVYPYPCAYRYYGYRYGYGYGRVRHARHYRRRHHY